MNLVENGKRLLHTPFTRNRIGLSLATLLVNLGDLYTKTPGYKRALGPIVEIYIGDAMIGFLAAMFAGGTFATARMLGLREKSSALAAMGVATVFIAALIANESFGVWGGTQNPLDYIAPFATFIGGISFIDLLINTHRHMPPAGQVD